MCIFLHYNMYFLSKFFELKLVWGRTNTNVRRLISLFSDLKFLFKRQDSLLFSFHLP